MYDRILFPTDGSEPAASVLDYAVAIAGEHGATLHVLTVADTGQDTITRLEEDVVDALEGEGRRIVEEAAARASDRGVSVVTEVLRGDPHERIVGYAGQVGADCIVMPTHGRRGLRRLLLGSVTERVINTAPVPVVAINPGRERALDYPPDDVLVPTDGSSAATLALRNGVQLAEATAATLHLLNVIETGSLGPDARSLLKQGDLSDRADEIIAEAVETAEAASLDPHTSVVEHSEPARAIREYIEDNGIDLAVLGTQGTTNFSRYVLGGVAAKLVRTAPVPVMWVRKPDSEGEESEAVPDSPGET